MNTKDIKVDRRVLRTKRLLKHAFIKLMDRKSFDQITVTDIVEYADYNRATFYRHYDFREELVNEIISDKTNALIQAFRAPYQKNNYIHLNSLVPSEVVIFNHIIENQDFYKLWKRLEAIPGFKETFLQAIIKFYKQEIVLLTPHDKELDNSLYTSFYAHGILGLILDWIENGLVQSPNYMAIQLCKVLNYYPAESYIDKKVR